MTEAPTDVLEPPTVVVEVDVGAPAPSDVEPTTVVVDSDEVELSDLVDDGEIDVVGRGRVVVVTRGSGRAATEGAVVADGAFDTEFTVATGAGRTRM